MSDHICWSHDPWPKKNTSCSAAMRITSKSKGLRLVPVWRLPSRRDAGIRYKTASIDRCCAFRIRTKHVADSLLKKMERGHKHQLVKSPKQRPSVILWKHSASHNIKKKINLFTEQFVFPVLFSACYKMERLSRQINTPKQMTRVQKKNGTILLNLFRDWCTK